METDPPVLTFPQVENAEDKNKLRACSPYPGRQGPRGSQATLAKITPVQRPQPVGGRLSLLEKNFLLAVERGDVATVRRALEVAKEKDDININCSDPLGRSALLMAIDNENLKMVLLLIESKVETRDALLHAINEQYVEAVEVLLQQEEETHIPGELHTWEAIDPDTASFTPDITPLILAAHRDNYEIVKILLDRGATLPVPHDVRCGCDECVTQSSEDSLRHSRSRINAYRALASPSLIALSSKDPIMTAFELSWELRRLSFMEHEFKLEYQELRMQCQDFATALLDHTRSSYELEVLLNHDPSPNGPDYQHGERMDLNRLKLAIKYKQKKFCAHPNVQQLLASLWYEGLPGFRRKNMILQSLEIAKIGLLFPFYSIMYVIAPRTQLGRTLRKPFIKFICHSASYVTFLCLLILASQRIKTKFSDLLSSDAEIANEPVTTKRGAEPTLVEWIILAFVMGLIWTEIKQLWEAGLMEYISDMWNIIDFVTNSLYVATVGLRIVAYFQVRKEIRLQQGTANLAREYWDAWDPMLIAEGLFSAANIFSSLKLVYIFSVNPHLGPLQISLGRMVIDIIKFFFIYTLVLFSFACGMNQLLWYYAELERGECHHLMANATHPSSFKSEPTCLAWRRFANLFETTQTLFWASFGLIDLSNFELKGIKSYTRFWGMLMFGCYSAINVVVLLNLLIAMMNTSYQIISTIMRNLVRRYVTAEQRKSENAGVTEDDVNEIKQDISSFRYELIEILGNSGMNTASASGGKGMTGKKNRQKERRLMKGFNIGLVEESFSYPELSFEVAKKSPMNIFPKFTRLANAAKTDNKRHKWGNIVEAAKTMKSHLARSRSEDSIGSQSSHSQISPCDLATDSNGSDLSLEDVEIIPDAGAISQRRRLRLWKENSTSTEDPRGPDYHDLAGCESGLMNRRFAVGVLSLNPTNLKTSMEQYQKKIETQRRDSKTKAKRTSSAPSDRVGLNVRFKRNSKKSTDEHVTSASANPSPSINLDDESKMSSPYTSIDLEDSLPSITASLRKTEMVPPNNVRFEESPLLNSPSEPTAQSGPNDIPCSKYNGNSLALTKLHGIQPVNRQMSAGWL